jgi:fermentation-respiration switch protein FrsA (DUF1100 family)
VSWGSVALQSVRLILAVSGIVVAAVLALKIAALLLESRLTFHPPRGYAATPGALGLPFEDVFMRTEDGVRIHGWFIPGTEQAARRGNSRAPARLRLTLLLFHGNAENIGDSLDLALLARLAGYNLMLVDYRGYGESAGQPSESGLYRDGRAALAYLRSRQDVDAGRIVVWGRSIGSAVAVEVAADGPEAGRARAADAALPAGVILESPFTSVPELLRDGGHSVLLALSRFGTYRFDSASRIGRVAAPVLVIHGTADEIAPFGLGRRLFDLVPGRKEFVAIEGGGHNDLWAFHKDEMWGAARRFLETLP